MASSKELKALEEEIRRDLEKEFWGTLEDTVPDRAVEIALEDVKATSDFINGYYNSSDITLAVQRLLLEALEFFCEHTDAERG